MSPVGGQPTTPVGGRSSSGRGGSGYGGPALPAPTPIRTYATGTSPWGRESAMEWEVLDLDAEMAREVEDAPAGWEPTRFRSGY